MRHRYFNPPTQVQHWLLLNKQSTDSTSPLPSIVQEQGHSAARIIQSDLILTWCLNYKNSSLGLFRNVCLSVAFREVLLPNHTLCQTMLSCLSPHNHYLVTISMRSKPLSETSKTKAWQMGHFLVCMFKVPTVKNLQVVGLWGQSRVDYKKPECQSQLPFLQQEDRFAAHTGVSHWSVKFQFLTA